MVLKSVLLIVIVVLIIPVTLDNPQSEDKKIFLNVNILSMKIKKLYY